jgi:hypothetical protein
MYLRNNPYKHMKNHEIKSLAKSARKSAAANMEAAILAALKTTAVKLGQDAKHFNKVIEKGAAKLAKKLSKEMAFDEPAKLEAGKTSKTNEPAKPANMMAAKTETKPAVATKAPETKKPEPKAVTPQPAAKSSAPVAKPSAPKANSASKSGAKPAQPVISQSKPAKNKK